MRTEPPRAQHPPSIGLDVIVTWGKESHPICKAKEQSSQLSCGVKAGVESDPMTLALQSGPPQTTL